MKKIIDYKLIKDLNSVSLESRVKKLITESGYEPHGTPLAVKDPSNSDKILFCQAMVKKIKIPKGD